MSAKMPEWQTAPPDFTVYGFHTGKKVDFRLSNGEEKRGIYIGWEVFNSNGTDYTNVAAWREALSPLPEATGE